MLRGKSFIKLIATGIHIGTLLLLNACASSPSLHQTNLKVDQKSLIQVAGKPSIELKAGEAFALSEYPVLVEAPGFMSVLLVAPKDSSAQDLSLRLRPQENFGGKSFDHKVNLTVGEVVSGVNDVQILLASKKVDQAFEKLNLLQQKFPEFTWLNFLRASCLVVKGQRNEAKAALEVALKDFPDDAAGKKFYDLLNGKVIPPGKGGH